MSDEYLKAREVGIQIRALLMSLTAPEGGYDTDALREIALQHAGFCWLAPGEMAPSCCCPWNENAPEGPMRLAQARMRHGPMSPAKTESECFNIQVDRDRLLAEVERLKSALLYEDARQLKEARAAIREMLSLLQANGVKEWRITPTSMGALAIAIGDAGSTTKAR